MQIFAHLFCLFFLMNIALSNPVIEEKSNTNVDSHMSPFEKFIQDSEIISEKNYDESQNNIKDDEANEEDIDDTNDDSLIGSTISLPTSSMNQPTQSPFVDDLPHQTESYGPDPRFIQNRACAENQYLCKKASKDQLHIRCIPNEWKCNGIQECEENDDELYCPNNNQKKDNDCRDGEYKCSVVNNCITSSQICDGRRDCLYGDDERQCENRHHQSVSHAPEIMPEYNRQQDHHYSEQTSPYPYYPQRSYPQPEPVQCPKPAYSDEHVRNLVWLDKCVRSCVSRSI